MNCCDCPWKNSPDIEYEILYQDGMIGIEPQRGTKNSSGIDVFIPKSFGPFDLYPGDDVLIPLNIRIKIPKGFDIEVKNKSGIALGMKLVKGAQLIDQDYRGVIKIHLFNIGKDMHMLDGGMKIAQLVVRPVLINEWKRVESIDTNTDRGEGGFGSTGDRA